MKVKNKVIIVYLFLSILFLGLWSLIYFGLDINLVPNIWWFDWIIVYGLGSIVGIIAYKVHKRERADHSKL